MQIRTGTPGPRSRATTLSFGRDCHLDGRSAAASERSTVPTVCTGFTMIQINDWPAPEPESEARASAARASNPVRRLAGLRKIGTAFAWFAGVGAILGGLTGNWSTYRTVTTELLTPVASKPMASRFSIAGLPFANLGGDSRQGYLADGGTHSSAHHLSRA